MCVCVCTQIIIIIKLYSPCLSQADVLMLRCLNAVFSADM